LRGCRKTLICGVTLALRRCGAVLHGAKCMAMADGEDTIQFSNRFPGVSVPCIWRILNSVKILVFQFALPFIGFPTSL
jgi:hypothetical protein